MRLKPGLFLVLIPELSEHSIWNAIGNSCKSNNTSLFRMMISVSLLVWCQSQSQSAIAAALSSIMLPGCKRTFQLTQHSTATLTYRSDVHPCLTLLVRGQNYIFHSQRNVISLPNTNYDYLIDKLTVLRHYSLFVSLYSLIVVKKWQNLANYFIN